MSRAEGMTDTSFLIANAQIVGFPIVYVSDHFSRLVGHRCRKLFSLVFLHFKLIFATFLQFLLVSNHF